MGWGGHYFNGGPRFGQGISSGSDRSDSTSANLRGHGKYKEERRQSGRSTPRAGGQIQNDGSFRGNAGAPPLSVPDDGVGIDTRMDRISYLLDQPYDSAGGAHGGIPPNVVEIIYLTEQVRAQQEAEERAKEEEGAAAEVEKAEAGGN